MSPGRDLTELAAWGPELRREPTVRVGVVLDEDGVDEIRVGVPAPACRLAAPGGQEWAVAAGADLQVRREDETLVATGSGVEVAAACLRLEAPVVPAGDVGSGMVVRDVVAGRGFHWQKRVDQEFAGVVELRAGAGGVVVINELPLEQYLMGVITAEMGAECPLELLKAQCVVARSWLLALSEPKHLDEPFDRCNDDCCQRYQGMGAVSAAAREAVESTRGLVLLTEAGEVLDANYSKCCGGVSEEPRFVWGQAKAGLSAIVDAPRGAEVERFFPLREEALDGYLDGAWLERTEVYCSPNVVDPADFGRYLGRVDEPGDYFRWTVCYGREELVALLRRRLRGADDLSGVGNLEVTERGVSGRVSRLVVHWQNAGGEQRRTELESEYRIREALSEKFLYSSAFAVRCERDVNGLIGRLTLRGAGWGHGAGLCQIGALGMALGGRTCAEICEHYYPAARSAVVY